MNKKHSITKQGMYEDFHRFVKKPLEKILGGEVAFSNMNDKTGQLFAQASGIDAVLISPEEKLTGINMTILYGKNLRVFGICSITEGGVKADYEKYHLMRNTGGFTPQYHVQVYLDEDRTRLFGMAVAKMEDIYQCLIEEELLRESRDHYQARVPSKYHVLKWDVLSARFCWCRELKDENAPEENHENTD